MSCEGFRALAYESLQCRNPRARRGGLWVNGLWDGLERQALVIRQRSDRPGRRDFMPCKMTIHGSFRGVSGQRHARLGHGHAFPRRPRCVRFGRLIGQAMPGHDTISPAGGVGCGGARGWHQRVKVSTMVMCPPQHGHGGRLSGDASGSGSAIGAATPSSLRASARLSLRAELDSSP